MKSLVLALLMAVVLLSGCGGWDAMSPPDIHSTNALASVQAFVAEKISPSRVRIGRIRRIDDSAP